MIKDGIARCEATPGGKPCGYEWKLNRTALQLGALPVKCPKCQSRNWLLGKRTKANRKR